MAGGDASFALFVFRVSTGSVPTPNSRIGIGRSSRALVRRKHQVPNLPKYARYLAEFGDEAEWLGDLDSNQGCTGQSREFYR